MDTYAAFSAAILLSDAAAAARSLASSALDSDCALAFALAAWICACADWSCDRTTLIADSWVLVAAAKALVLSAAAASLAAVISWDKDAFFCPKRTGIMEVHPRSGQPWVSPGIAGTQHSRRRQGEHDMLDREERNIPLQHLGVCLAQRLQLP